MASPKSERRHARLLPDDFVPAEDGQAVRAKDEKVVTELNLDEMWEVQVAWTAQVGAEQPQQGQTDETQTMGRRFSGPQAAPATTDLDLQPGRTPEPQEGTSVATPDAGSGLECEITALADCIGWPENAVPRAYAEHIRVTKGQVHFKAESDPTWKQAIVAEFICIRHGIPREAATTITWPKGQPLTLENLQLAPEAASTTFRQFLGAVLTQECERIRGQDGAEAGTFLRGNAKANISIFAWIAAQSTGWMETIGKSAELSDAETIDFMIADWAARQGGHAELPPGKEPMLDHFLQRVPEQTQTLLAAVAALRNDAPERELKALTKPFTRVWKRFGDSGAVKAAIGRAYKGSMTLPQRKQALFRELLDLQPGCFRFHTPEQKEQSGYQGDPLAGHAYIAPSAATAECVQRLTQAMCHFGMPLDFNDHFIPVLRDRLAGASVDAATMAVSNLLLRAMSSVSGLGKVTWLAVKEAQALANRMGEGAPTDDATAENRLVFTALAAMKGGAPICPELRSTTPIGLVNAAAQAAQAYHDKEAQLAAARVTLQKAQRASARDEEALLALQEHDQAETPESSVALQEAQTNCESARQQEAAAVARAQQLEAEFKAMDFGPIADTVGPLQHVTEKMPVRRTARALLGLRGKVQSSLDG